jgi:hypothetical protein
MVLASNMAQLSIDINTLWWVFFSVVVSSTFANTAFVSERLTGSLEIVLTCGLSRSSILLGKMAFVLLMSFGLGLACFGLGLIGASFLGDIGIILRTVRVVNLVTLYLTACLMNAACCAWLSIRLSNPRLSHFANLLVLGVIVGANAGLAAFFPVSIWILPGVLFCIGLIFYFMALRDFSSERVTQPPSI